MIYDEQKKLMQQNFKIVFFTPRFLFFFCINPIFCYKTKTLIFFCIIKHLVIFAFNNNIIFNKQKYNTKNAWRKL